AVSVAAARGTDAAPNPAAALVGGATAVLALWLAALAARRGGVAAVPLALAAVGLAAVTGWAAVPGEPGPAHLLVVVALGGITAAVALVMLRVGVALLVALIAASALAGVALAVATLLGGSSAGVAASAAAVALAVGPLLPRLSARLAGLPPPVIVADFRELLQADDRGVQQPEELFDRTGLTHDYLAGMVAATAAVAAVGAVLAGLSGGWAGPLFAGVVVAVLLLRSRGYVSAAPVLTLLIAGTGVAAVLVAVAVVNAGSTGRLAAGVALLGVAAAAVVFGGAARQRPPSPVLRRAIDVLEALLVAVTFPLALAVLDLYRTIRGL
ncbi:MAG: type VII secretion integral membrane protein EccD, partial [Pseudonocardia sp.]